MNIATTLHQLFTQYGHIPGISIECQKELVAIGIRNQAATAEVFLQGAQVTRYRRTHEPDYLFLSDACTYQKGSPLRGGIPICWPWFGDLSRNHQEIQQPIGRVSQADVPAHGFVRYRDWTLESINPVNERLTILNLSYHVEPEPLWPFATKLLYRIEVGEQLTVSLSITNTSEQTVNFSGALHTYFAVSHIQDTTLTGLHHTHYIDALDDWQLKQERCESLCFDQEVDRIYPVAASTITLHDKQRVRKIHTAGSASTVIWNPWVDKSIRLSQFNSDDYQRMVCIETANALDDKVVLPPQQTHTLSTVLF